MAVHIMHDIETLSTENNALILSIGAVKFDHEHIIEKFEVAIFADDAQKYGLHIDAKTVVDFWFDPKRDEARRAYLEQGKVDLFSALDGYAMWVRQTAQADLGSAWANGATFDHIKLESAYKACKLDFPFTYKQQECYRTISNRFKDVPFERRGTHHAAIDDAESQAVHLMQINAVHNLGL
jgi:hypothetical protein